MKKNFSLLILLLFLTGCAETMALLGPASTSSLTGGNMIQSASTSVLSYGVKKKTGKTPMEHAISYAEKHNPERKKSKCISFLDSMESELCQILKKNISDTKNKIIKHKIVKSSKIEDLAKNSDIHKRR
jgi:hypothetical protein|tara:strand:- start:83 stop:469 length:387 start_codon:yes stop_codon:yes gene_type:complete